MPVHDSLCSWIWRLPQLSSTGLPAMTGTRAGNSDPVRHLKFGKWHHHNCIRSNPDVQHNWYRLQGCRNLCRVSVLPELHKSRLISRFLERRTVSILLLWTRWHYQYYQLSNARSRCLMPYNHLLGYRPCGMAPEAISDPVPRRMYNCWKDSMTSR